jgi:hypothetical protein
MLVSVVRLTSEAEERLGGWTYVRCEHRGGDFAAVFAVADVRVDEVIAFDGLSCVSVPVPYIVEFYPDTLYSRPQAAQHRSNRSLLLFVT